MTRVIVRTEYGARLQSARHLGMPHAVLNNTTMNQAITDTVIIPQIPAVATRGMEITGAYDSETDTAGLKVKLFCIGNGGHAMVAGPTGGVPTTRPVPHKATDACLYRPIPFVVRPIASDLDVTQRANYRLRRTVEIGGQLYVAYYGRVLDFDAVELESVMMTTVNGSTTTAPFVPTINNLRPVPPSLNSPTTGTYVSVSAGTIIQLSETECQWIRDACELMFGDANYAIISEIGICSGIDKEVTQRYPNSGTQTPSPSAGGPYYETVACQINTHVSTYHSAVYTNDGLDLSFDIGATEPLFGNNAS